MADPIELTVGVYDALNGRDFDALVAKFAPDSVWDVSRWGLGTHAGRGAISKFLHDWFGSLDRYEVRVHDMHHLGNGVVYATVLQIGHGGGRGDIRVRSAPVYVWEGDTIAQVTVYPDLEEGRRAALSLAADRAREAAAEHNVELATRIVDAVGRRAVPEELLAAGFRMDNRTSSITDRTYHGARGVREWMGDLFEVFAPGPRYEINEVLATGENYVVASYSLLGRGARSGRPLELRWTGVTWFRDGKATRAVGYTTREEALRAVRVP
jgi:ketosteroid isomerase-like protein